MWDGFNKRKFPRVNVNCEIVIHREKETPLSGVTENLGVGGVCIMLARPLERFSTCHLRLELGTPEAKVDCHGKVVWAIPTKKNAQQAKQSYDIGIEFVDLSEESRDLIGRFLREHFPAEKAAD